jgi:hypothetical protein
MCTTSARPATRRHAVRTAPPESALRVEDTERSTLRVGDTERENTAARLGAAFTLGYLSMDEYEARLGHAFGAQTAAELDRLTTDLPVDEISRRDPRRRDVSLRAARRGAQVHLISYVALSLLMIGIWLAVGVGTGSWYFWPIWPILGMGIGVIGHAMSVAQARGVGLPANAVSPSRRFR